MEGFTMSTSNQVSLFNSQSTFTLSAKTFKTGSIERLMIQGDKASRTSTGLASYKFKILNGQYKPVIADVIEYGLIPKASAEVAFSMSLELDNTVNKDSFIKFCNAVVRIARSKKTKDGYPVEYKGTKLEMLLMLESVVANAQSKEQVIEQQ
jgi:hypothetical protein